MMEIAIEVAKSIVQNLVDGAINETRYLCCYGNIVEGYENERSNLMNKQRIVEEDVEEAKNKNEEPVYEVRNWQSKAADLNREDTIAKKSCFFGLLPNCIWLYRRGRVLERKTKEIKNLIESAKSGKISRPIQLPGVEYYPSEDFIPFESRNSAQKQLLEALKNSGNYMIGLHGIGGSGKTKLAIEVGKEVQKPELFDKVIFVVVSNPPNVRKIQDDIASTLTLSLNGNESERFKKLWLRLRNGQKILIILDDVWEKLNFKEIGIPSRDNHEGCRVLLTTRDLNVCKSMGCQQMIHLELLPENEAWDLFKRFADISGNTSSILKDVAQKIAFECKGLPVAIIAIASTLKGHPLEDWKAALTALKSSKPIDYIHEDLKDCYKCLRVSYDYLKSDQAKCLFLLCSMFPEDYEISNEELIRYAIGIGLFGELQLYQISRSEVRLTKDKLINSCLLLNAENKGCVKMHDLVRDVAHWIANSEIHETMEPKKTLKALQENSIEKQDKVRYLYCHNISDFSYQLDLPNLEILVLACKNDYGVSVSIPDTFFHGMKGIRILTIKGEYHWETFVQLRPTSIEVLKNLRSLDLRYCNLGDISAFESLQKIETLELYHCSINELPNGIVELKKLRLFRLQSCRINESPYKVIDRFSEIEELYLMENRISNGRVDRGVVSDLFDEDRISPALERYHIEIGVDNNVLNGCLNESTSRALSIGHFDASISNVTMKDMMRRAEILCLYKLAGGCKSISPDFAKAIGGDMIEWIKLGLDNCSEIECLIDTTKLSSSLGTVFSNLITLHLHKMDNLKELCHGSTPSDFLQKLEDLSIDECGQLQSGLLAGNVNVQKLRKLSVGSCPNLTYLFTAMEYIIKEKSEETLNADHDDGSILGSNRRQLSDSAVSSIDPATINYGQLQNRGLFVGNFNLRTLQNLSVYSCPKLTYLFTVTVAQSLVLLEELEIGKCDAMKCIMKDESRKTADADQRSSLVSIFPKLQTISILYCGQLECFLSVGSNKRQTLDPTPSLTDSATINYGQLLNRGLFVGNFNLRTLQNLFVESCPKLTYLFTVTVAQNLVQLEYLEMKNCDTMKCIIKDESGEIVDADQRSSLVSMFPKLWHISIDNCGQLECFLTDSATVNYGQLLNRGLFVGNFNLKTLRDFSVKSCPKLTYLFTVTVAQSLVLLEELHIRECDAMKCIIEDESGEIVNADQRSSLVSMFPKLQNVNITYCDQLECFLSVGSNKRQTLDSTPSSTDSATINYGQLLNRGLFLGNFNLRTLQNLTVESCPKLTYLFTVTVAQSLVLLEALYIRECDAMKCIIKDESGEIVNADQRSSLVSVFPKLQSIIILNCGQLECFLSVSSNKRPTLDSTPSSTYSATITYSQLQNRGLFVGIQSLFVQSCPKLTYLFNVTVAQSLVLLEELQIIDCDAMKCIIKDESGEIVNADRRSSLVSMFPKLRIIRIDNCSQVECFLSVSSNKRQTLDSAPSSTDSIMTQMLDGLRKFVAKATMNCSQLQNRGLFVGNFNLRTLQNLSVYSCPKLTYLFTVTVAQSLVILKLLFIWKCDAMKCIIKDESGEIVNADQRSSLVSMFRKLQSISWFK